MKFLLNEEFFFKNLLTKKTYYSPWLIMIILYIHGYYIYINGLYYSKFIYNLKIIDFLFLSHNNNYSCKKKLMMILLILKDLLVIFFLGNIKNNMYQVADVILSLLDKCAMNNSNQLTCIPIAT